MKLLGNGIILTDVDVEPSWKIIGELLEQRAELLEALKDSLVVIAGISSDKEQDVLRIRAVIAKAEASE